jgi:hypothetical protein
MVMEERLGESMVEGSAISAIKANMVYLGVV